MCAHASLYKHRLVNVWGGGGGGLSVWVWVWVCMLCARVCELKIGISIFTSTFRFPDYCILKFPLFQHNYRFEYPNSTHTSNTPTFRKPFYKIPTHANSFSFIPGTYLARTAEFLVVHGLQPGSVCHEAGGSGRYFLVRSPGKQMSGLTSNVSLCLN